jgi:hypothetical protein
VEVLVKKQCEIFVTVYSTSYSMVRARIRQLNHMSSLAVPYSQIRSFCPVVKISKTWGGGGQGRQRALLRRERCGFGRSTMDGICNSACPKGGLRKISSCSSWLIHPSPGTKLGFNFYFKLLACYDTITKLRNEKKYYPNVATPKQSNNARKAQNLARLSLKISTYGHLH